MDATLWATTSAAVLLVTMLLNAVVNVSWLQISSRVSSNADLNAGPASGPWPDVDVFIPARNEEANLKRLLESLFGQEYAGKFRVHVHDDASEDRTWDVLAACADVRLRKERGEGPPAGWMGKVYALYRLTRGAEGACYLFLDADTELVDRYALHRLVSKFRHSGAVLGTGVTRLRGGGLLLGSHIGGVILSAIPWWLGKSLPTSSMAGVNGQCWLMDGAAYRRTEPHLHVKGEVLEDIHIGRYLFRSGYTPVMLNAQTEVLVHMYDDLHDAWLGYRKNAYAISGGTPFRAIAVFAIYVWLVVVAPVLAPGLAVVLVGTRFVTDRFLGLPWWVTLMAPVSYVLGGLIQVSSAQAHFTGTAQWKGRQVAASAMKP
ncbi:MAG: glycosyl transferase family 2 [Bacteroidetes bacterium CG12_big_fil_rev_8_21_14_0_65_60_17]|nr:MAG: glycosyl transferase family 2 [Bacteroidetes bacterium CG12_big_fil_rev_8_21_14_0_65_60_17]